MAIRKELVWETTQPYYYRFTCESCGCRTHWIKGEMKAVEKRVYRSAYDKDAEDRSAANALARSMAEKVERVQRELNECCAGNRMLTGDINELTQGVLGYFGEVKCPKCKQIQSWAPRVASGFTRRKQQKNADAFNATPVLSRPEVVFGGDVPEPDEPDFAVPCRLEIHGTSLGVPHESPVYLNGIQVGATNQNSIDISVETRYRDNLIVVDKPIWTSYIEAEEGKTLQLGYKNFVVYKL